MDEVRETVANIRHRDFPVLDENQNYVGMFSRRNLMKAEKKKLILVDHNEKSQAVSNIDEAEILEIIDHHRLAALRPCLRCISAISRLDVHPPSFIRCIWKRELRSPRRWQD